MYCIYRCFNTQNYIYPFQNLSLDFILKIFLKFRKFQPRYSYKIYSYIKKRLYRYKQKQTPWHLDVGYTCMHALLSHQTLSVIAPIFLKSVFVKLPDGMSRWSFELVYEILRVPISVRVFFILSIRNLDLQSGECCIK